MTTARVSDDYTWEEMANLTKWTMDIEPATIVAFDTLVRGRMPFYRTVNAAIRFFIQVYTAKHGDVIDFPVPQKVGRIRVEVKR